MAPRISRRKVLGYGGLGVAAVLGSCAYVVTQPPVALAPALPSAGVVSVRLSSRIRLHMFQTGWVAVKAEHRAFGGPVALRLPAIMASRTWTEWMPVTAFAIEHPEGLFLIDTGETAAIHDRNYATCDPITGMFYRNNLKFSLTEDDEIGPQMTRAGLAPDRVSKVVMTHLHSDHMGGMGWFPQATFLVSEAARAGHAGALMCRIPASLNIETTDYEERQVGVFSRSAALTEDGTVSVIPTPGHARGHQSVLITDEGKSVCLAGDAAFTLAQIIRGEVGGIVENHPEAVASASLLEQQIRRFDTILLPTHDPDNQQRLSTL
ncbi:N-acyl homoserine lactonase family protein [Tabrizicola sp.]|uniref:N-acyl homoserine lactonase family protein n=1 Tax=Tabrizicola sp. TaxID=2005166 RepID=UPI003F3F181D